MKPVVVSTLLASSPGAGCTAEVSTLASDGASRMIASSRKHLEGGSLQKPVVEHRAPAQPHEGGERDSRAPGGHRPTRNVAAADVRNSRRKDRNPENESTPPAVTPFRTA